MAHYDWPMSHDIESPMSHDMESPMSPKCYPNLDALNCENRKRKTSIRSAWNINTSIIYPLVMTPREVYMGPLGFFFTPIISRLNVHLSSGWVTWALVKRNPVGRMNRSYFGGFLVKPGPTNVAFVTILFHCFAAKCWATYNQICF